MCHTLFKGEACHLAAQNSKNNSFNHSSVFYYLDTQVLAPLAEPTLLWLVAQTNSFHWMLCLQHNPPYPVAVLRSCSLLMAVVYLKHRGITVSKSNFLQYSIRVIYTLHFKCLVWKIFNVFERSTLCSPGARLHFVFFCNLI